MTHRQGQKVKCQMKTEHKNIKYMPQALSDSGNIPVEIAGWNGEVSENISKSLLTAYHITKMLSPL